MKINVDRNPELVVRQSGRVVTSTRHGEAVRFFVEDAEDTIQSKHNRGKFYEEDELVGWLHHYPRRGQILDVGANVGNHALFFARFTAAESILAIEPNPKATVIFELNMALNGVTNTTLHGPHVALGEQTGTARLKGISGNLGGTHLVDLEPHDVAGDSSGGKIAKDDGAVIRVSPGDALVGQRHFDLIKVDAEGFEMAVLAGLGATIRRCRPLILVEVLPGEEDTFDAWREAQGYRVLEARVQPDTTNMLMGPA